MTRKVVNREFLKSLWSLICPLTGAAVRIAVGLPSHPPRCTRHLSGLRQCRAGHNRAHRSCRCPAAASATGGAPLRLMLFDLYNSRWPEPLLTTTATVHSTDYQPSKPSSEPLHPKYKKPPRIPMGTGAYQSFTRFFSKNRRVWGRAPQSQPYFFLPTTSTFSRLVLPGVSRGTPAAITTRSPSLTTSICLAQSTAWSSSSSEVCWYRAMTG